ncbi:class I SAM-dependent methyltransferase [Candidatus Chrysopegis kryptomonas]|uniref:Predicted nicotinamide N-methyase n=1 Tax=Candidatus Chryseopegocella kryptomonas TaxID=1633643 RepID=A0A0P1N0D4_9BACT|nr:methyltransferase [Candidatus Chrysopegis kryptomonas]CUT01673.1 Predicted nicotinamide N-methyase [Candidatus Chrysopegis kryptomonas]
MLIFEIANKKILIETPFDPKDYLKSVDDVVEKYSTDYKIPFWIDVWPSAIALAEFILESDEFSGKKVLELGCGLGLTTVALGLKNAIVTATDYEMMALQYARRNYIKNVGNEESAKFVYLDWRHPVLSEKFDFVIGADIIYERELFQDIVNVLRIAMTPNSICYLADPNRIFTIEFFEILKMESFDFEIASKREVIYRDMKANVSIYRIKKSQMSR